MNSSIGEERRGAKMLLYLGLLHTEMEPAPQQEGARGLQIGRGAQSYPPHSALTP